MTLIDKLPQEEQGARFFYDMLSDFVHPNIASNFVITSKAEIIEENKLKYKLSYRTKSAEVLGYVVLHTISIPIKNSLHRIRTWISQLRKRIQTAEEGTKKLEEILEKMK